MTMRVRLSIVATIVIASMLVALVLIYTPNLADEEPQDGVIEISGFVEMPLSIELEELREMPSMTIYAELVCVSGYSFGYANWTGPKLWDLIELAGVREEAIKLAFVAADGFTTDLTIDDAMRDDIILAYEKDGELLEEQTRLVVPGKWGYKWIANLTQIELVDYDFKGSWESRGYPDEAIMTIGRN